MYIYLENYGGPEAIQPLVQLLKVFRIIQRVAHKVGKVGLMSLGASVTPSDSLHPLDSTSWKKGIIFVQCQMAIHDIKQ